MKLYPLRFRPILRPYPWGGRRLETSLGKPLPPGDHWAESWEIADHGPDQSIVQFGPLAGTTLAQLVAEHGRQLLGGANIPVCRLPGGADIPVCTRRTDIPVCPEQTGMSALLVGREQTGMSALLSRFPLLVKFLDAASAPSVQVHPDDARAALLDPPEAGKTEAWVVLEAGPESVIYAGLKPGVDRAELEAAIRQGRCPDCLHAFAVSPGDCIFVPAGTVHALGAGLLVAEIQQPSDVTYRLFDWNRVGPDGRPRPLHVQQGLEAVDFRRGPLEPQRPRPTDRPQVSRLIECDKFVLDRWEFDSPLSAGGDDRFHVIAVLQGAVRIEGDPADTPLPRGGTALLPAALGRVLLGPQGKTVLLDAYLP
jgi:mannose-6-phosphate isomerase